MSEAETGIRVKVWDLPTRLFHWTLVLLVLLQFATADWGLLSMQWHFYFGYATLALVLFRLLWGLFGSETSRFRHFLRGPRSVHAYIRSTFWQKAGHPVGHNPLGGWSVVAILTCLIIQAVTGLFASDDITAFGPLSGKVSDASVRLLTAIHSFNQGVLIALIGLHVAAVLLHALVRKENLVHPMLHGHKWLHRDPGLRIAPIGRALLLALLAAGAVAAVVAWGQGSWPF